LRSTLLHRHNFIAHYSSEEPSEKNIVDYKHLYKVAPKTLHLARPMPRHANYIPHGVIPAVLLPFANDLAIDEQSFRKHLRDVASVEGLSAMTINAHSTEVGSCTFDEQRRVLEIAQEEIGAKLPLINGVWADSSIEAARLARMATQGGASALLVFPPTPFTLGQSPPHVSPGYTRSENVPPFDIYPAACDSSERPSRSFDADLTTNLSRA
jgi:Dihydrodipicolinate synthetase family